MPVSLRAQNKIMLAKTFVELKDKDSAREWLKKILEVPEDTPNSPPTKAIQEAARKILDGL